MWLLGLTACMVLESPKQNGGPNNSSIENPYLALEEDSREAYLAEPISFSGQILDKEGSPVAGAVLTLQGESVETDSAGIFVFPALIRQNANLYIQASGYRSELFPVHLAVALEETEINWAALPLQSFDVETSRLYFAGDVALGRRFLELEPSDRDEFPTNDPNALISVDDPLPGSLATVQWMVPYFNLADGAVLNFESPVTETPVDPHPTKDYVFFTLPESLAILPELGVDYVSLGNNHIYDYKAQGLIDTFAALDGLGVGYSGAGLTPEEAWRVYNWTAGQNKYTLISACSITGDEHSIGFVASETQGGAANLRSRDQLISAFDNAEHTAIGLFHTGNEYANFASAYSIERAELAIEHGAGLIISHHPHVTQHWGSYEGVLAFHSLGNFIFDQDRMDTMLGLVAEVDMQADVVGARSFPIYIEDYRPRGVAGALADRFLMGVTERSEANDVSAITAFGRSWVDDGGWALNMRSLEVLLSPNENGEAIVDLRPLLQLGERIRGVQSFGHNVMYGSDMLIHGDLEDYDVDDEQFEASRWDIEGDSRYLCTDQPYRGVAALCAFRSSGNDELSSIAFRHRIRLLLDSEEQPNRFVTILGYRREDSAGPSSLLVSFYASVGEAYFGEQEIFYSSGGESGWQPLWSDIQIPDDPSDAVDPETDSPRALRIFLEHEPPSFGYGRLMWDDLAVISWEEEPSYQISPTFLRVTGLQTESRVVLSLESFERSD